MTVFCGMATNFLQLVLARVAFGLAASAMQPSIIRLVKENAPPGMDARAISYAASFHCIGMGFAPFCAGLIGPAHAPAGSWLVTRMIPDTLVPLLRRENT